MSVEPTCSRRFSLSKICLCHYASTAISRLSDPSTANSITKSPTCKRVAEICPRLACQVNLCDLPSLRISSGKDSYSFAEFECASSVCQSLVEVDREYLCFHIVSMSFAPILNLVGLYGQGLKDQEKWLHESWDVSLSMFPLRWYWRLCTAHFGCFGAPKSEARPHIPHALSPVCSVLKSSHQTWSLQKKKWQHHKVPRFHNFKGSKTLPTPPPQNWKAPNPAMHLALFRWFLAKQGAPQNFKKLQVENQPNQPCLQRLSAWQGKLWLSPPCLLCHAMSHVLWKLARWWISGGFLKSQFYRLWVLPGTSTRPDVHIHHHGGWTIGWVQEPLGHLWNLGSLCR